MDQAAPETTWWFKTQDHIAHLLEYIKTILLAFWGLHFVGWIKLRPVDQRDRIGGIVKVTREGLEGHV